MSLEAVIFDKDDTLLNTEMGVYFPAHQKLFNRYGGNGNLYTPDVHNQTKGPISDIRFELLKERFGLTADTQTLISAFRSIYTATIEQNGVELMEGAQDLLEDLEKDMLRRFGVNRLAVVTNAGSTNAEFTLRKGGIDQYFATVVSADDLTKEQSKPHPEALLTTAGRLGTDPTKCAVIGDSYTDIEAAKGAGMFAVLLNSPLFPADLDRFKEKPDWVVGSLTEITPQSLRNKFKSFQFGK